MPRTVPAAILAKTGNQSLRFIWLVEWRLSGGTQYYSDGPAVSFGGNNYQANRIKEISGLTAQYIDGKNRDFDPITITFDNLADNQSSAFPFTALDAVQVFEDAEIRIHLYDVDAAVGVSSVWFGYSRRPTFDPDSKYVSLQASFLWDSPDQVLPSKSLQQSGFGTLDTNRVKDSNREETAIPLVYGVSDFKIRPTIYSARVVGDGFVHINFIVSGCANGFPFQATDLTLGKIRLFDNTQATAFEFLTGSAGQAAPSNKTRFPDGLAHPLVAYAYTAFPITDQIKDKLDSIIPEDVKLTLVNGRPLADTGLPSENPILILKDILRDPNFGLGLANAAFDATAVTAAAAYASTHWQARLELHERMPVVDLVQQLLGEFHGYLTFNNGLIQIGCKTNAEASVATFATTDSGFGGRTIHLDNVKVWEKDSSELINETRLRYRKKNRQKREVIIFDPTAQARPGGTIKRVVPEEIEVLSLYDDTQVQISGAILIREQQSSDLFIDFACPLVEGLDVAPGDLITVRSPDIFNNASNFLFRVLAQSFDTGDEPLCRLSCQVYKPAVYNYDTVGIGIDLLRGGNDTSSQGRPPDVTPTNLQVIDVSANDTEGKLATIRGIWTYPVVDLASEQADGVFREYPISAVHLWWHYTDESINEARLGKEVKYPTPQADFQLDWHKNRSIRVFFVVLGHNRSRAPLGYIPDPTKVTHLTADLSATAITAQASVTTDFAVNDFAVIEFEIDKVLSKTSNSITFVNDGSDRTPQLDTTSIAHPSGTEIAVAKLSYPSLVLALNAPRFTYPIVTGLVARQRSDGVRVKYNDPDLENKENFLVYWSSDSDAGSNAAKLGSATPSWYLADPLSPPSGINLRKNDDLDVKILNEDIGAAGVPITVRVAARNGKLNFSSQLSSLASNAWGDDAAPVFTLAPRVVIKKKGLRVVARTPTTNMKTFPTHGKIEHVIRAVAADSSILGYLTDQNGTYESSASEYKFDMGLQRDKTYNIDKQDVLAIWPTVDKLKIYAYVSNAVGTSTASPITDVVVSTWEADSGAATPGALAFPVSLSDNTVDDDPEATLARLTIALSTSNGLTFGENNITRMSLFMIRRNEANTANLGSPFTEDFPLDPGANGVPTAFVEFLLPQGKRYRILSVTAWNGDKRTVTTGTLDFIAANLRKVTPAESLTVPAPTFQSGPTADGNKLVDMTLRVAQDGTHTIWFKLLILEKTKNGGTTWKNERTINLKAQDTLHASASAFQDFDIEVKRKPSAAVQFRARVIAVGGKSSANTTPASLGAQPDDQSVDTAEVSAPGAPTVAPKPSHIKVKCVRPTSNFKQFVKNEIVARVKNGSGVVIGYIVDGSSPSNSSSEFLNDIGPDLNHPFNWKRSEILALHPTAATIEFYNYITNGFGTSSAGSVTSLSVASWAVDPAPGDGGNPSAPTPAVRWRKKGVIIGDFSFALVSNNNTIQDIQWYIGNASTHDSSTTRLNLSENTTAGGTWHSTGQNPALRHPIALKTLKELYGASATIWIGYRIKNTFSGSYVESTAQSLSLGSLFDVTNDSGLEVDATIPAKTLQLTTVNMIVGGSFLNTRQQFTGNAGDADRVGKRWHVTPLSAANHIDKLSAGSGGSWDNFGVMWDQPNHRLKIKDNIVSLGGKPSAFIRKQIIPGETYACSFLIRASSGQTLSNFKVHLWDDGTPGPIATVTISSLVLTSTEYKYVAVIFSVPTNYQMSDDQFLSFEFSNNLSGGTEVYIDNVMAVRNQQSMPWSPAPEEAGLDSSIAITTNTGAGSVGANGGAGNTGTDGSTIVAGQGGVLPL